jgi:hypothetical protein
MGAYENPAMIRQTAGLYWARAVESLGQSGALAINKIFEEQKRQALEQKALIEKQKNKRDALLLNSWDNLENLRNNTIKALGENASEITINNVDNYINQYGEAFVASDAMIKGGYGTEDQRKKAFDFKNNFTTTAALKVEAAKNFQEVKDGYKKAITDSKYNFLNDSDTFAWAVLSNDQAGLKGINNFSVTTTENDKNQSILKLKVSGIDKELYKDYGLNYDENGDFNYEVNLNTLNSSQIYGEGLPFVDATEIAKAAGVVNENNALNDSMAGVITKGSIETTYYPTAGFSKSLRDDISATVDSWYSVNDSATTNQIKGQLKAWGLNDAEVKNIMNPPKGTNSKDIIKNIMMMKEMNKVYGGSKEQAAVVEATPSIIAEIKEINKTKTPGTQIPIPNVGDLIAFSQRKVATKSERLTDLQRQKMTDQQLFNIAVKKTDEIWQAQQGGKQEVMLEFMKGVDPSLNATTSEDYLLRTGALVYEESDTLEERGKKLKAAALEEDIPPVGIVKYSIGQSGNVRRKSAQALNNKESILRFVAQSYRKGGKNMEILIDQYINKDNEDYSSYIVEEE